MRISSTGGRRRAGVALALVLSLGGCVASDVHLAAEELPDPSPMSAMDAPVGCLEVTRELAEEIMEGTIDIGMTALRASAVRSPDFAALYFIAVEFTLFGSDDVVGVWASDSLTHGGGLILAVDAPAKEFSDWVDVESREVAILPTDRSITLARACVASATDF
jgi:hypothetical protein